MKNYYKFDQLIIDKDSIKYYSSLSNIVLLNIIVLYLTLYF